MGQESNEFMKSYNMLLMNGIIGILGAIVISYASFQRWEWTFVHAVPELVEKGDWGIGNQYNQSLVSCYLYTCNGQL